MPLILKLYSMKRFWICSILLQDFLEMLQPQTSQSYRIIRVVRVIRVNFSMYISRRGFMRSCQICCVINNRWSEMQFSRETPTIAIVASTTTKFTSPLYIVGLVSSQFAFPMTRKYGRKASIITRGIFL